VAATRVAASIHSLPLTVVDVASSQLALSVEVHANELAEARRVVVAHSLGVAEGFEHRVGAHDLLLE